MSHKINWNGEILSLRTVCKKEGISAGAVYNQIYRTGEDPKTVLLYFLNKSNKGNREKIEINGIIADLKTHCKNLGVSYEPVIARKNKTGESAKESLLYFLNQPNKGNREKIEINGIIADLRTHCKNLGVSYNAVWARIEKTGESAEEAITYYINQPNKGNREKFNLNGKLLDIKKYCKKVGVNYGAVFRYKNLHPDMEYVDIINMLKNNVGGGIREKLELNGEYLDIKKYCEKLSVNYNAVIYYKELHPEMEYIDIINILKGNGGGIREKVELNGKFITVKKYCDQLNYDYKLVTRYKASQPNKTYTEILSEWPNLSENDILNNVHLYDIWTGMLARCYNPKNKGYKWYGGKKPKPVIVCEEWHDYSFFKNQVWNDYIEHVEQYGREQTTIDRKKSWYNYSYKECQWADWKQQGRNTSKTRYILPCKNYQKTLLQHCKQNGYVYITIVTYIKKYNLTPDQALAKYLEKRKNK